MALLITEFLQKDFAGLIGKSDPTPTPLHIGFEEARRLNGEDPASGPVNLFMGWAYRQPADQLGILHVRDFHDPHSGDLGQHQHLEQYGNHCVKDSIGAEFIFDIPEECRDRTVDIVNCPGFNDFQQTDMAERLEKYRGQKIRVGVIGVWTEAKVANLCYELNSRYPEWELAVCSALTAGNSRKEHFSALRRLHHLYGVHIIDSITEFANFLGKGDFRLFPTRDAGVKLEVPEGILPHNAEQLVKYMFRDCETVSLKILDGGFSGNYVLGCISHDSEGREQAPHVLKIGPRHLMARERAAFEEVEPILGNSAPRIVDFADNGEFGAIKYRYASMDGGAVRSFQKIYMEGAPLAKIKTILDRVFVSNLGKLYAAAEMENCNLLSHYGFRADLRSRMQELVAAVVEGDVSSETLDFYGQSLTNPAYFYSDRLEMLKQHVREDRFFADVHGDLNGANILRDNNDNVWLIDFFHVHYGHVLTDLLKLENDVLYIMTPVADEASLQMAMRFSDCMLAVKDLATPPHFPADIMRDPHFGRAARTVQMLRSYYPALVNTDLDPTQAMIGQMRYAMHTLHFEEPNIWQRRWALYMAGNLASAIDERLTGTLELRIADIPLPGSSSGKLGLTILPGRKDRGRDLDTDIAAMKAQGVTCVYSLITDEELRDYGVPNLMESYRSNGINAHQIRVVDGGHATQKDTIALVASIDADLAKGENIAVHCLGGLGRSGTAVANVLTSLGLTSDEAITEVRKARGARAIENRRQEAFIHKFAGHVAQPGIPDQRKLERVKGIEPS